MFLVAASRIVVSKFAIEVLSIIGINLIFMNMSLYSVVKGILLSAYVVRCQAFIASSFFYSGDSYQFFILNYIFISLCMSILFIVFVILCFYEKCSKRKWNENCGDTSEELNSNEDRNKCLRMCTAYSDNSSSYVSSEWDIQSNDSVVYVKINDMDYRLPLSLVTPNRKAWEYERDGRNKRGDIFSLNYNSSYPFLSHLYKKHIPLHERYHYACPPLRTYKKGPWSVTRASKQTQTPHLFTGVCIHLHEKTSKSEKGLPQFKPRRVCSDSRSCICQPLRQSILQFIHPSSSPSVCKPYCQPICPSICSENESKAFPLSEAGTTLITTTAVIHR